MASNLTLDEACALRVNDILVFNPSPIGLVEEFELALGLGNQNLYEIKETKVLTDDERRVVNVCFKVREYLGDHSPNELYGYGWFRLV